MKHNRAVWGPVSLLLLPFTVPARFRRASSLRPSVLFPVGFSAAETLSTRSAVAAFVGLSPARPYPVPRWRGRYTL